MHGLKTFAPEGEAGELPEELCRNSLRMRGGRGARMARSEEGAYLAYATDERRSQAGWIAPRSAQPISEQRLLKSVISGFKTRREL